MRWLEVAWLVRKRQELPSTFLFIVFKIFIIIIYLAIRDFLCTLIFFFWPNKIITSMILFKM